MTIQEFYDRWLGIKESARDYKMRYDSAATRGAEAERDLAKALVGRGGVCVKARKGEVVVSVAVSLRRGKVFELELVDGNEPLPPAESAAPKAAAVAST